MELFSRIRFALTPHQRFFVLLLLAGLIINASVAVADPLLTKTLIDQVTKRNFVAFSLVALAVILFGMMTRVALMFYGLASQRLQNAVTRTLTLRMLAKYYDTPFPDIAHSTNGYFVSRIYDEPCKVAQGVTGVWIAISTSLIIFLASLSVCLYLSWHITLLLTITVPSLFYLSRRFTPKIRQKSQAENENEAQFREFLGRATQSYKTVKLFDLFNGIYSRIADRLQKVLDASYSRARASRSYQTLSTICLSFAETAVLISAGYAVLQGTLTLGGLFGFMSAFWKLINAGGDMIRQISEISRQNAFIDRLMAFYSLPNEDERLGQQAPSEYIVECKDLTVKVQDKLLVSNINFRIGHSERVLLVGPNGSGKTTIANVLAQFTFPSSGAIVRPTRSRLSALLTPFHFLPGTLLDNVQYDRLSAPQRVLLDRLVQQLRLEDKLDSDLALAASEGEKRKCQVLMVLLKDADLYIFDEPLANVDSESKDAIFNAICDCTHGKAVLVIMHGDQKYWPLFDRTIHPQCSSLLTGSSPAVVFPG